MAGETYTPRAPSQPGGRPAAPGSLALVQAFLNTHYDLAGAGGEMLHSSAALAGWLVDAGLLPEGAPVGDGLGRALAVREGLRSLALANNGVPSDGDALARLNRAAQGALLEIRLEPDQPRFVLGAQRGIDAALGLLLGVAAQAMLDGKWRRLKACPGEHCGWAFYDASRNQIGRWCSMSVCGGRAKARTYYRRQTAGHSAAGGAR